MKFVSVVAAALVAGVSGQYAPPAPAGYTPPTPPAPACAYPGAPGCPPPAPVYPAPAPAPAPACAYPGAPGCPPAPADAYAPAPVCDTPCAQTAQQCGQCAAAQNAYQAQYAASCKLAAQAGKCKVAAIAKVCGGLKPHTPTFDFVQKQLVMQVGFNIYGVCAAGGFDTPSAVFDILNTHDLCNNVTSPRSPIGGYTCGAGSDCLQAEIPGDAFGWGLCYATGTAPPAGTCP